MSYAGMLVSFKDDLSYLHENLPEGRKAKARELEEHRVRTEYLQHEVMAALSGKACVNKREKYDCIKQLFSSNRLVVCHMKCQGIVENVHENHCFPR